MSKVIQATDKEIATMKNDHIKVIMFDNSNTVTIYVGEHRFMLEVGEDDRTTLLTFDSGGGDHYGATEDYRDGGGIGMTFWSEVNDE